MRSPRPALFAFPAALAALLPPAAPAQQVFHGPALPRHGECVPTAERATILARIAAFHQRHPGVSIGGDNPTPDPYRFVPMAGALWDDVDGRNFVDLDPGFGVLDHDCTDWTYDTHRGHDYYLRTFDEMDLGVPVVAALPGIVVDLHDGEPDRNTVPSSAPSNYVILWHGGSHYTWYLHLRRQSITVAVTQRIAGGQQLGLVGSSGNSAWPHLHFESWTGPAHYEPNAGPCRPGPANWQSQPPRRAGTWVADIDVGAGDFHNHPPLPIVYPRRAAWGTGWQYIGCWLQYRNLPANSTWRARWLRPDSSVAIDSGTLAWGNGAFQRADWAWFRWWVDCNQTGTWQVEVSFNGNVVAVAPFHVLTDPQQAPNHAPAAPTAIVFVPAAPVPGEAVSCRVTVPLIDDADSDLVAWRFTWRRNGNVVRDVTIGAHADFLPDDVLRPGDALQCTVTPIDSRALAGPGLQAQVAVGPTPPLHLERRGDGHLGLAGKAFVLGPGPRQAAFTPDPGNLPILAVSLAPCGTGAPFPQAPPCALPAGLLWPDPAQGPLLSAFTAQVTVPATLLPWRYCLQGAEIAPSGPGFCLLFTAGHDLTVRW